MKKKIDRRNEQAIEHLSQTPNGNTPERTMTTKVTLNDIRLLRDVAAIHGDCAQVRICERALAGSKRAIAECRRVIQSARAEV